MWHYLHVLNQVLLSLEIRGDVEGLLIAGEGMQLAACSLQQRSATILCTTFKMACNSE